MIDRDIAIRARNLGKQYTLGDLPTALLSERVERMLRPSRRPRSGTARGRDEFWALRDIDFEIRRGEVVGIVGRNGSGKSTLLKIISRITSPTVGEVAVRGRVGTLLEVGTGFHPELNGRENIFLNGAILGMKRREIGAKYDEIVEFAGVERFLETPVKRYSSGMYVRLAFAVAAHLEPEILLVDEVLAVGDAEFQQKCLGKLRDVSSDGRTVVFVSHNLGAVRRLCERAILLDRGTLVTEGPPSDVVAEYMTHALPDQSAGRVSIADDAPRMGTGEVRLRELGLTSETGEPLAALHLEQPFRITAVFEVGEPIDDATVEFGISSLGGERVVTAQSIDREGPLLRFMSGLQEISADFDLTMLPGEFSLDVAIHHRSGITIDFVQEALRFTALNAAEQGHDQYPWSVVRGFVRPRTSWSGVRRAGSLDPIGTVADRR
jgi:lipopolysaccharide transport system ATP-binding protein